MVRCKRLKSGIFIAHERLSHINGVNCRIEFKAGYTQERPEKKELTTIAHLVEHMICKDASSKNYSTQDKKDFAMKCLLYNATSSFDIVSYYATMHKKYLEEFVKRYADYIKNPAFKENELEDNKKVIIEEFYKTGFNSVRDIRDNFYYSKVIGTPNLKRLASINKEDLPERINSITIEDCYEHIKSLYTLDNCYIFVNGNVSLRRVVKLVKKYLEPTLQKKRSISLPYFRDIDCFEKGLCEQVYKEEYKNKNKLYLAFGDFEGQDYTQAFIIGDLLHEKFKRYIRDEKSLSYAPYAEYFSNRNYGVLEAGLDCTDISFIDALNAMLEFFAKKLYKASQEEMDEIIERYLLSKNIQFRSLVDKTSSFSSRFAYCQDFRSDKELDKIDKQIKNFKVEEYERVIEKITQTPPHLFMACPNKFYDKISYNQIEDMLSGRIDKIQVQEIKKIKRENGKSSKLNKKKNETA